MNSISEQNNFDKKTSGVNYERVFERLFNAKRPLILLGHGVKSSKINKILNKSSQFICIDEICLGRY